MVIITLFNSPISPKDQRPLRKGWFFFVQENPDEEDVSEICSASDRGEEKNFPDPKYFVLHFGITLGVWMRNKMSRREKKVENKFGITMEVLYLYISKKHKHYEQFI